MQRLERSVGIELAAGPFAPLRSPADQDGSVDNGRNESHAARPLRVEGGECVTANTVDARSITAVRSTRTSTPDPGDDPATASLGRAVEPNRRLRHSADCVDSWSSEASLHKQAHSKYEKLETMWATIRQNRTSPSGDHTGERRGSRSGEDDHKGVHRQQVPRTDIHSGHHRHSKIKDGWSKRVKQLAVSRYLPVMVANVPEQ